MIEILPRLTDGFTWKPWKWLSINVMTVFNKILCLRP